MAAAFANSSWDLGSSRRGQDYRTGNRNSGMAVDSQNWVNAVVASSNRAASQNNAATNAGATIGSTGLQGITALGQQSLRSESDLMAVGANAVTSAYNAKTGADALVKREKAARGSSTLQGIKMAGGLGMLAYGMTQL